MKLTFTVEMDEDDHIRSWPCRVTCNGNTAQDLHEATETMFLEMIASISECDYDENTVFAQFVEEVWRIYNMSPLEQLAEVSQP